MSFAGTSLKCASEREIVYSLAAANSDDSTLPQAEANKLMNIACSLHYPESNYQTIHNSATLRHFGCKKSDPLSLDRSLAYGSLQTKMGEQGPKGGEANHYQPNKIPTQYLLVYRESEK